jgi:beta-lactamase class A
MNAFVAAMLTVLLAPASIVPGRSDDDALPLLAPAASIPDFPDDVEAGLQRRLEARIGLHPRWAALARERRLAVGLVDLARLDRPRFAAVHPDWMMYAASLPKIAILLAAHQALDEGALRASAELDQDLQDMIRVSDNAAATRCIDRLGYDRIAACVTDPRHRLFDPAAGGGLWVGKRYAKEGPRLPDPLRGLVHAATVRQVCRFYHRLLLGRLVSPERSRAMLDALIEPGLPGKFACALAELRPRAALYRKSGSWRIWHADSVLVWELDGRRYVLAALVEDPDGERILQELVPAVETLLGAPPADARGPASRAAAPAR